MESIAQFAVEFFGQFFGGLWQIIKGLGLGLFQCVNVVDYWKTVNDYVKAYGGFMVVIAIIFALLLIAAIGFAIYGIILLCKKGIKIHKTLGGQEKLIEEVQTLNREVMRLNLEKDKILSMKVSQIGLSPNELSELTGEEMKNLNSEDSGDNRFYRLKIVDEKYSDYDRASEPFDNDISLEEICDRFRNFACSRLNLYYDIRIVRLFLAGLSSTRLVILQGISGTGKTSLPYAWGKFLNNDAQISAVQPSWRDRTEFLGFFNDFTKRYTETQTLKTMYEATYTDKVYFTILDEMNISRIEYYFAEMLSILEMPSHEEWVVDLVPSGWATDPKHIVEGRFRLPDNMWYIGTANNDDSTFAISDKVYDRAIPINIDTKGKRFDAPFTEQLCLNYHHLEELFDLAKEQNKVSQEALDNLEKLDDYIISHFRVAFGNRIVKQLRDFVPAYVGCGGTEIDGIDYVLCNKILRKFEQLNLAFIHDEIDGLIEYLSELFGEDNMQESKAYLGRLKKMV